MDTSEHFIRMCDCPEIQGGWKPKVGDYVWRKYTIFGEELDRTIWPEDKRQEVVILHYQSSVEGYYHAVNAEGDERIFASAEDIEKVTSIWLPRQDQLQEMVGDSWIQRVSMLWRMLMEDCDWAIQRADSLEQAWLMLVMHEKYGKHWTREAWVEV